MVFEKFKDSRIPSWYRDARVWRYLRRRYGLRPGGIVDDDPEKPPIIIIEAFRRSA